MKDEIVWFLWKTMSRTSEGWRASLCSSSLFTLDSTGHCKTVLNNDGFCQLFNARPPSPLCHYVIISSTPSFPCLLPSPNRHITKHTQWHCAFSHHHFWHSMRRHPLFSQLAPLGAISFFLFFDVWGGVGPVLWLSDLSCCQKEATARHSQGQRAVALEGAAAAVSWLLHTDSSHSVCETSRRKGVNDLRFLTSPALFDPKEKNPDGQRRTHLWVACYWWGQY